MELARIKVKALFRSLCVHGIEEPGVDQRLVDPPCDSDLNGHLLIVSQLLKGRVMIRAHLGRYIRYWYTYRTVVAVLIALVLSGSMYWLYTQQVHMRHPLEQLPGQHLGPS